MRPFYAETIQHGGRAFEVSLYSDYYHGNPWDESDGHGAPRCLNHRETMQRGEVWLCDTGEETWAYDFGAALLKASREKWGLCPDDLQRLTDRIGKKPSKGQIRAEAVRKDMEYLRGFICGDWHYMGVCVRLIGPDGAPEGDAFDNALWGVESSGDHWREVAQELANEILHVRGSAWRAALHEARARKYWASRDVQTVGAE